MQVSVENTGPLERRMTVQLPAEQVDQEIDNRLKSLARTARLDGFRPGKVPMRVIKQRFGRQVEQEVANELIGSSFQEALSQQNLRPAGGPRFEPGEIQAGQGLEYVAIFEVYPEFEPAGLEGVEIEKPAVEVSEADVDAMIDKLRQQRASWESVERPAKEGDQVTVDFKGTIEGEPFEGGEGSGMQVEIGSGRMIDGFEEGLVGAKAGDELTLDLKFPEDYGKSELAGKPVQFAVKVTQVAEPKLPEVDEDFARSLGIEDGSVESLRSEIQRNMQRELDAALKAVVKDRAFEALLAANEIEVPAALVDEEIQRLSEEMHQQLGGNSQGLNLPGSLFEDKARRRVTLGLIIGEIVKRNGIQVDPERVRSTVENIAASYEKPEEVVRWYYENQEALASAQTLVLEEQVVEWILGQAKVSEKPCSFDELIEMRQAANS
ncbi:trigger factor [Thiohalobacter sp. IOR34]|uniref:trigger factor n=1 Tax=Thiohalobacter sp. IOR34 TaxID=3057176 RepID=UPI0025B128D1|nr:trigger factor [Thiohalobacter sp. IOR34]WJW74499.1 trigger factor [Thiohalobacter sp. IOR34]